MDTAFSLLMGAIVLFLLLSALGGDRRCNSDLTLDQSDGDGAGTCGGDGGD